MTRKIDRTGHKYGSCHVLGPADPEMRTWRCRCLNCGDERVKSATTVRAAKCEEPRYCNRCQPVAAQTFGLMVNEPMKEYAGGWRWNGNTWASSEIGLMQQRFYLGVPL